MNTKERRAMNGTEMDPAMVMRAQKSDRDRLTITPLHNLISYQALLHVIMRFNDIKTVPISALMAFDIFCNKKRVKG